MCQPNTQALSPTVMQKKANGYISGAYFDFALQGKIRLTILRGAGLNSVFVSRPWPESHSNVTQCGGQHFIQQ